MKAMRINRNVRADTDIKLHADPVYAPPHCGALADVAALCGFRIEVSDAKDAVGGGAAHVIVADRGGEARRHGTLALADLCCGQILRQIAATELHFLDVCPADLV